MLIFALILITTIALVTGALLTLSGTKFIATVQLRKVAGTAYAADAAAKVAINDVVYGGSSTVPSSQATYPNGANGLPSGWVFDNNTDGTGCFGKSTASGNPALDRITLPSVYTDAQSGTSLTATVVCSPVAGTGLFGSNNGAVLGQPNSTDPFARALTTVGTGSCTLQGTGTGCNDGITLKGLGSGAEIPVRGSIQAKTSLNVSAGTLRTNGTIYCASLSGSIITAAGSSCTGSFVATSAPTAPLASVPAWKDPSTQGCSFVPGFYNNATALSAAVNACSTATFASGKYYFDFADNNPWEIATTVIGGQLVSGATQIPGRCVSPIDSTGSAGVQFVFGGNSYLEIDDSARVELCGPTNGGAAPMTIYQQQTGSTPAEQTAASGATASAVATVTGGKFDAFVPTAPAPAPVPAPGLPDVVKTSGDSLTAAWKSTKDGNTGELDLQNFPGLDGIPVGGTITSAKVTVTWSGALTASSGGKFTANVAPASGAPLGAATNVAASGTATDITTQMQAQFAASTGFSGTNPKIQLALTNSKKNDAITIDAVKLEVKYVEPALRAPTAPVTFITDHGGNFAGKFVVQGATYAPKGYITLTPGSDPNALVALRWGVYAWGVNFKSQPSQTWGYPLISIPDVGLGLGSDVTAVDFQVFICTGTSACSTTGAPALSSRVMFTDKRDAATGLVAPVAGQRKVEVLSWAEQK
jgi:hypothetical protein